MINKHYHNYTLFSNFVHAIMYINNYISRHDAVRIVDNQLCIVESLSRFSVHAVTSIWGALQLDFIVINDVFLSCKNINQKHCAVGLDSLGVVVAF